MINQTLEGIDILEKVYGEDRTNILSPEALQFVAKLERTFGARRRELLQVRVQRQAQLNAGQWPDFHEETSSIRNGHWTVSPPPNDLKDRRVEITGPAGDRKMVINALNSGAMTYMSDFEDANSPTWDNTLDGQVNLRDAINGTIQYTNQDGRTYRLKETTAVLIVRPRGWHLEEKHMLVDGRPVSAALFDFGLYFFHNAKALIAKQSGPYFYLPKLESYLEARLWNDVFVFAQQELGIPQGTIKATVLIETILASFEMHEILYELREHSAGLNCGRWDYIFSTIKKLREHPEMILPDRSSVTMASPFMHAYSLLAIQTCHQRGIHCIGGMAPQIPIKNNSVLNDIAMKKVREDKRREAKSGHDGTWVAHPGLVSIAREVFDELMPMSNQIHRKLEDVNITAKQLLEMPKGSITEEGFRLNIRVGILYTEAWLRGYGAVPINYLMEDAATAEISRAQLWQWIHHPKGLLEDGRKINEAMFKQILEEELAQIKLEMGEEKLPHSKLFLASSLFSEMTLADEFQDFLTLEGYKYL